MKKHRLLITFLSGVLLTTSSIRADTLPADDEHDHDEKTTKKLRGIQWAASFGKALEAAKKKQRPLLVDFEADWCGWCKKLDRDTYGNEAVIRFVNGFFVAVKVDTDHEKELAKQYKVSGLPTILVLGSNGSELQRLTGYRPPEKFLTELKKSTEAVASLEELKANADKNPSDLDARRAYARAVFAAGNTANAIAALRKALKAHPDDGTIILELADMLRVSDKPREARVLYEKLLGMAAAGGGADAKTLQSAEKAYLPLARLSLNAKDYKKSVETLTTFLSKFEKSDGRAEGFLLRAYAFAVMDESKRSLADLEKVIALAPDSDLGLKASYIVDLVKREQ